MRYFSWILAGTLLAASAAGKSSQAQTPGPARTSVHASHQAQKASTAPTVKPFQYGVWRHFGESVSAPPARSRESLGWPAFAAPHAAPIATRYFPPPGQPSSSIGNLELERQMLELVNRDRSDPANTAETGGRAGALRWNDQLAAVALQHSRDMMTQRFFAHTDSQGRSPAVRINAAGIQWQAFGENIALCGGVRTAESAFMNEPRFAQNHRANILNRNYTDIGIGIVHGPDGRLYITQDFIENPTATARR